MNEKILIVDDERDIMELMMASLRRKGYQVRGTLTCSEGLEIFYSFKPDLVLLDINVGDEDGRKVCSEIKSQAIYQNIPVVMVSANHEGLQDYHEYGANDFLHKPFTFAILEALCVKHLNPVK